MSRAECNLERLLFMILITAPVGVEAASHVFAALAIGSSSASSDGETMTRQVGRTNRRWHICWMIATEGLSVFAACRSLLPFAFDMVTHDLLSDVHDANEGHPSKNIAVAMI